MSARNLAEIAVDLIEAKIKADIPQALSDVRTARADGLVTTEPPKSYFIFPKAIGYKTPAVFTIVDSIDFQKQAKGANHITALMRTNVTVLLEDKDKEKLTIRAWRYQAALHEVLDQARLTSADGAVALVVVVTNAQFSPLYTNAEREDDVQAVFRKEVRLECEVNHFENF